MDLLENFKLDLSKNSELYLNIKAIPGAAKTEAKNIMADGTLKIAVAAAPEKGRANEALIGFLAEEFDVAKKNITLISGASGRAKLIKIKI